MKKMACSAVVMLAMLLLPIAAQAQALFPLQPSAITPEVGAAFPDPSVLPNPFAGTDQLLFNLTNPTNNQDRAIHCFEIVTSIGTVGTPTEKECLNLWGYSPSGVNNSTFGSSTSVLESSIAYIVQTGGGNALTVYNLAAQRPPGYHNYISDGVSFQGFAIEEGCDGIRTCFWAQAFSPGGQAANFGWTTSSGTPSYGAIFFPSAACNTTDRAISIQNAGFVEKTFIDDCGNINAGANNVTAATFLVVTSLTMGNGAEALFQGPFVLGGGPPTIASGACGTGTSGTVDNQASNLVGTITVGSGTPISCILTFNNTAPFKFASFVHCRVTPEVPIANFTYTVNQPPAPTLAIGSSASLNGKSIDYQCDGA